MENTGDFDAIFNLLVFTEVCPQRKELFAAQSQLPLTAGGKVDNELIVDLIEIVDTSSYQTS